MSRARSPVPEPVAAAARFASFHGKVLAPGEPARATELAGCPERDVQPGEQLTSCGCGYR